MPKSALPTGTRKSAGSSATPKANTSKDKKQQQQTQQAQQTQQNQQAQKNYPSKKAAWVAEQIAQGNKPEQRNFLAETATSNANQRRSNNEYRKQQEQKKQNIYSGNQEDADMDAAWANLEGKKNRNETQTAKDQKRANAKIYTDEADRLEQEKRSKYGVETDLFYNANQTEIDEYDRKIAENRAKAKAELSDINTTSKERDAILDDYLKSVENERTVTANATDLNRAEAEAATADRKAKENALKDINRLLGNDVYYGLVDEAQSRDIVEGWQGERQGQYGAAVGTGLEWLGHKINETSIGIENPDTGEVREIRNFGGKGDRLEQLGSDIFQNSKAVVQTAQEDWDTGTSTMSDFGKSAAGVGKTVANTVEDMVANFMLPGAGSKLMALRVAGAGALEQDQREGHNDIDSRATKALLDGGAALLSNWAIGGISSAYGKSVLGKAIGEWAGAKGLSPMMQRALNTEGIEEVAELGIGYIGDRVLGLVDKGDSFWSDWSWREAAQEYAVGYFLGFLLNAGAGGQEVDAARAARAADESVEFGERVAKGEIMPDDAIEIALSNPNENAKMTGQQKAAPEATAEPVVETEAETTAEPKAPTVGNSMDTGRQSEKHDWIRNKLSGGALSEDDISTILSGSAYRQAFKDVTGVSLDGMDYETARQTVGMAAGSVPVQGAPAIATETPVNETIAAIQKRGTISPREAARIQRDPALRAAFEEAYGISLEGMGETKATQAITDAVNERKAIERATGEFFEVPPAEPGADEGPGEKGSKERKQWNKAMKAKQDVADILAQESLSRKDATRLMSDNIMWQAFQDATGIDLGNKPRTEQNVREAFNEAKANMPSEPEVTAEPEAETTAAEPEQEQAAEPTQETTANTEESETGTAPEGNDTTGTNPEQESQQTAEEQQQNEGNPNTEETAEPNPNQKQDQKRKTDHTKKVEGPDENTDEAFDKLNEEHGSIEKGENPARDINVPKKDTKGNKVGEGARTVFEADATPEERVASLKAAVVNGNFGHVPVGNDVRSKGAASKLAKDGWAKSVADFRAAVESGRADADMIALGAHLINEAGNSTECSGKTYIDLVMAYNDAVSDAGSRLAAGRILKTLTPEGKLYGIEKTVEKMNSEIRKNNEKRGSKRQKAEIKLNEDLVEDFLNAKSEEERGEVYDKIIKDTADQVPNTFRDKFTALRYLNMLGNFKTQVRNLAGNTGMTLVQKAKNEMRGGIEGLVKAATGGKYDQQYKGGIGLAKRLKVASNDFLSDADLQAVAMGEKKFSDIAKQSESEIMDAKKPFSDKNPVGKFLNLYNDLTGKAMELGDLIFVRANYADALAGYMNAHGITEADWNAMVADPEKSAEVDKARAFAIKQAQEATFRDTNAVSKFASTFDSRWPNLAKKAAQGVIPFRKTPANVLVRMEEYSPLGLANTAFKTYQAITKQADASEVIDSAAKTLTGSGLAYLGYLLASMKMARTKDDDKGEEALAKLRGQQDYSIEIGGKSITMDWLSPASAPFFMGVEAYNLAKDGKFRFADLANVLMSVTNPMLEMSMLSGVNDALSNLNDFEGDNSAMMQFVLNSAWSYLTQGVSNTLLGQVEQFTEKNRQTYYTDSDNPLLPTWAQKKISKLSNKTPIGKDYQTADYIDAWGRKQANDPNLAERAWNVFLNPGYVSKLDQKATKADSVIESLYQYGKTQKDHDSFPNVVPKTPYRSTTVNGKKLSPEEYEVFATTKGQESLKNVTDFIESDQFKKMDKYQQAETISEIYSYAEFLAASKIAKSRGEDYYNDKFSPLLTGQKEDGENTYKAPIKEEDIPEYLGFMNAYDDAMNKQDYDAVNALIDSSKTLPESARVGAEQHAKNMEKLVGLKDAGLSSAKVYYQFNDDMREIYESEKRVAPQSADYIRVAGSGKYSPEDADAIMGYERKVSEQTIERYQDQIKYNLDKAGKSGLYDAVWENIEKCADGSMTTDQFTKWVDKNVPLEYRQNIKDVRSNYTSDTHIAGKTISGIYRAMRDVGYSPEVALQFFDMIDTNYNESYTKAEFDKACKKAFGNSDYGKQVRKLIKEYVGK